MKQIIIFLMSVFAVAAICVSCERFLDKSPDMGLSEEDIFRDYNSIRGFLDQAYQLLENLHGFDEHANGRTHCGAMSDELASLFNSAPVRNLNSGSWLVASNSEAYELGPQGTTVIAYSYKSLRVVNRVIEGIDNVPGLSDQQRKEILGQAYFMRAFSYFQLTKRYGGMPIMDKVFFGDGDEDLPRQTYHGSHDWMMGDLERAITMLPDQWDNNNVGRATKIAAMSLKAMAQLYDASPLMQNDLTTIAVKPYDKQRAALAAKSASDVLKYIRDNPQYGFGMMDGNEYNFIFYWQAPPYTQPEYLWYNRSNATGVISRYLRAFWLPAVYASGAGNDAMAFNAPTQNMVDLFEKKGADGNYYPITDARAGYDPQKPYQDRDPRFTNHILYPGNKWGENNSGAAQYITLYEGGKMATDLLGNQHTNQRQQTGYVCKKFIWEGADQWKLEYEKYRVITVYIRVTQMYLDLAEASLEATGSATSKVDGCLYSAEEALNIVRNRVGVTPIPADVVSDPEKFRQAVRRERGVELMFENHRWWDIRRWMIAHELFAGANPIKGMRVTPNPASQSGKADTWTYDYEVISVIPDVREFGMRNYWYPFPIGDANSLANLVQNPGW